MSSKISLPELADLLARKSDGTKKEAEAFLKEFFGLATEVLSSGETLKINGLGTFKPVWVEKRSSINVQTGQPCEIPGHYKLSFLPDKSMRDAVNAPFACFDAEEISDGVLLDTAGTAAVPDEEARHPDEAPVVEPADVPAGPAVAAFTLETKTDDLVIAGTAAASSGEEDVSPVPGPEPASDSPAEPAPSTAASDPGDEPRPESDDDDMPVPEHTLARKKSRRSFWYGFMTALVLLLAADLVWLYNHGFLDGKKAILTGWFSPRPEAHPDTLAAITPLVADSAPLPAVVKDTPVSAEEPLNTDSLAAVLNPEPVVTAVVKDGVYLTTLALKHYGHKAFWVYIYQENQAKIANPNRVPTGMTVVIPEKSKYGIDADSEASVSKAKNLAEEILAEYE